MPHDELLPARLPKEQVPRTYTWLAPAHDLFAALVDRKARRLGLRRLAPRDGERLLEVGVGTGLTFQRLLRKNPSGWTCGVDVTPAMLHRAQRRARDAATDHYELRLADANDLPYPDAHFNALTCSFMLDLLPETDFAPVLREFRRVLHPGGRLVLVNQTKGTHRYQDVWEAIYRFWPPLFGGCRGIRMAPYVGEAGFEHVCRTFTSHLTFPAEVVYGEKPA